MECPELDLPEKDRCSLPELEYAGKMKKKEKQREKGMTQVGHGPI